LSLKPAWLALAALVLLAGCRQAVKAEGGRHLELSALPLPPTSLPSGTVVTVSARTVPDGEMAWVSGTVKLLGAPVLAMKPTDDGKSWWFRTMVPPMVTVPAGRYEVKAWGRTKSGEDLQGSMSYEVK
jgi:hypothetical protein